MVSTTHIAKELGQRSMADALGVSPTAVNNAVSRGFFPTSWFLVVREMCAARGIECPDEIFNFKSPVGAAGSERLAG